MLEKLKYHGDFFPPRSLWLLCSGSKVATSNIYNLSGGMVILCICVPAMFSNNIRERWMVLDRCSTLSISCLTWVIRLVILEDCVYTPWKCTKEVSKMQRIIDAAINLFYLILLFNENHLNDFLYIFSF